MSCRRGVPDRCSYLNSLAEKVRELWERCANAIKSINGINPDGANNFDILPGAGIQVNPRANGIEIVATGATPEGMIETINDIGPDENSNFSISAGSGIQINEGENGIEIENISEGAVYTGVSPIEVSADNEISLKDWKEITFATLLSDYIDANNLLTTDVYLLCNAEHAEGMVYLKKGLSKTDKITWPVANNPSYTIQKVGKVSTSINSIQNGNAYEYSLGVPKTPYGSGINQTFTIDMYSQNKRSYLKFYVRD